MVVFLIILVIVVIGISVYSIKMMMGGVNHSVVIPDTVFDKYNKMRENR